MGVITNSDNFFKSSSYLFSKVRRFLKSLDSANLIDEGEFPTYIKEIYRNIGFGAYREAQAILFVENTEAHLPDDFQHIYSAYKLDKNTKREIVQSNFSFVTDVTKDYILETNDCQINACENSKTLVESINIKTYTKETNEGVNLNFNNLLPLIISPNVKSAKQKQFEPESTVTPNYREITIDKETGKIYTHFKETILYIKYYALPIDEEGNLLVPDIEQIEKLMEWYIIYQILLSHWFNSSIPDISNKIAEAEKQYLKALQNALYYVKLPSFSQMVNTVRNQRSQNKLVYFSQQYSRTGFQSSR